VPRKRAQPTDNGVVSLIDGLMVRALDARASDIHFEPTDAAVQVRFRIDGVLHQIETLPLSLLPNVVTRLKVMGGLLSYRIDIPQEGGLTLENRPDVDARIATFPTIRGERAVVRLLPGEAGVRPRCRGSSSSPDRLAAARPRRCMPC
jgi:type II secretory ATPase GspE/PulE/Tfp pilus assembly ATPase PilB-like protein